MYFPKEQEHFVPKLIITPSGKRGAGLRAEYCRLSCFLRSKGTEGQCMKLTCGEILDENGGFTQKICREATQP